MVFYTILGDLHSIDHKGIRRIKDLKNYIIESSKNNLFSENLKITYNRNDDLIIQNDDDIIYNNIFYNISIVPINCNNHN